MSRAEMLLRHGYYAGLAEHYFGDSSYRARWYGRAEFLTEETFNREAREIQERLVTAGYSAPDEDPFEADPNMQELLSALNSGRR
jgi:hypothetical protein